MTHKTETPETPENVLENEEEFVAKEDCCWERERRFLAVFLSAERGIAAGWKGRCLCRSGVDIVERWEEERRLLGGGGEDVGLPISLEDRGDYTHSTP